MTDHENPNNISLTDDVLTALRQIIQTIDLHSRYLIKQHNITGPQLVMLKVIQNQQPISISEIAKETSLSVSTVTGILVRLENRQYIQRAKSKHDKRKIIIQMLPQGKKFMEKAPQPLQNKFLNAFGQLEQWEKFMILSSLQRLVGLMKAEDINVSPILTTGPIMASTDKEPDRTSKIL